MSDSLHPWILVNQYMQDEKFREVVIRTALEHLPRASHELQRYVSRIFARLVVPGFQSFFKANTPLSRPRVVPIVDKAFRSDPNVTAAVISLWSEASNGLIEELKIAAMAVGLCFKENWTWKEAQNGFIDFRAIPALIQVAESLAAGRPYPEPDHLRLAVLWLSGALLRDANSEPVLSQVNGFAQIVAEKGAQDMSLELPQLQTNNTDSDQPMALCDEALEPCETAGDYLMNAADGKTPLSQAKDNLEQRLQALSLIVQSIGSDVRTLSTAVEASDLDAAVRWHREVGTKLEEWRATQEALNKTVTSLSAQLETYFGSRPDLAIPQGEPGASLSIQAKILQEAIERIMAYDSEKAALVSDLKRMLPELWAQVGHIREWGQEISEPIESLPSDNVLANLTLTEVKGYVARLTEVYRSHDETLQRLRADAQARIKRTVAEIKAEGEPEDSRAAGIPLGALDSRKISELSDYELRLLESQLASLLQARRQARIPQSQILAAALRENWTDNGLHSLLSSLVHEQQKEAALLLLFAGTAFHPSDSPLTIDDMLAVTLIDAAVAWSSNGRPYELFGALAPDLMRVAAPEPGVAQARLCLALLGAQYGGDFRVPAEVVWQVAMEWPLPSMPGWARLWEAVAAEEPLPQITSTSLLDDHEVNEWRARAAGNLQREKGTFLRLQGLQSHRHRAVFSRSLMPVLASHLAKLQELEEKLKKAKEETTYRSLLVELEDVVKRQLTFRLAEDQVEEWYESEISAAQVDDAHPFHHRTALRLLQECAESVLRYGEELLQYYDLQFAHRNALRLEDLLMELQLAGGLVSLGDKVLQWVMGKSLGARSWTEAERRKG